MADPVSWHGSGTPRQQPLLPHVVDQVASIDPNAVYGIWPVVPTSYEAGVRSITYAQLANMVNGLARWLVDSLGQGGDVFAYLGPNDARLPALGLAGVKTGKSIFLTSPRNSIEAHASLLKSLQCTTLATPAPTPPPALPILETFPVRHLVVPGVDELLQTTYPTYEYSKMLQEGLDDTVMIIHTSGSTGIPKALVWTQETMLRHQNASFRPVLDGSPSLEGMYLGKRILVTLPPFHGAGLGQTFLYAIPFGNVVIAPSSVGIVTAQGLVDALAQTPADIALLVPSVVAELAQNPDLLRYCARHLEMIVYIGGDLPEQIGNVVAAAMPLHCQWGASEVGMPPQLIVPEFDARTDWKYVRFHPSAGITFDKVAENLYELVVRRSEHLSTQPTFTIPGMEALDEYRTRDLFAPHPTIFNAWAWKARADDIIVFLNGEKTNPTTMEQHVVARNPGVLSGALAIGAQHFQAALLLEPVAPVYTTAEQADLIEHVWSSIEEANRVAPAHARIEKSLVLVTAPDRPLVRAGKGTLQRGASIVQYEAEINDLYEGIENSALPDDKEDINVDSPLGTEELVAQQIRLAVLEITQWPVMEGKDVDRSLFELGMDSLQALRLMRALRQVLRPNLRLSTIYQNPTVTELTKVIIQTDGDKSGLDDDNRHVMTSLLATYRECIHKIPIPREKQAPSSSNEQQRPVDVVLTGSTGTLGSMILRTLLDSESIGRIFCLNRAPDGGRSAQAAKWAADGPPPSPVHSGIPESRVTFLQTDLARPNLGLSEANYRTVRDNVCLIIHSAWPVNFNLALSAFRPQLAGLLNLFALSVAASHHARVLFISSVGAVAGKPSTAGSSAATGPTPESIIDSLDVAHANGYSQSKLLAELLCDVASRHLDIPVSIARVGQVAGSASNKLYGNWNRAEWLPSLVLSSLHLGCIPEDLGPRFSRIDWIPSDLAAEVIVDLALAESH